MDNPIGLYVVLALVLIVSIGIDFFGHRDGHEMSFKESSLWSIFWIAMGCGVGAFIYWDYGAVAASEYFSGYAMEKALSIDNLMVFMAIFTFFGIKDSAREHKILLWGIAVLGKASSTLKLELGLARSASLRDALPENDLLRLAVAESLASLTLSLNTDKRHGTMRTAVYEASEKFKSLGI